MSQITKQILSHLKKDQFVLLIDDISSVYTAYLFCRATTVSSDKISALINYSRGVICVAVNETKLRSLGIPPMRTTRPFSSIPMSVSIEARNGIRSGISAADRATTIRTLAKTSNPKQELVMPGHIFPLITANGGVLVRSAVEEAASDLAELTAPDELAVISPCFNKTGEFANSIEIAELSELYKIPQIAVSDVIRYRLLSEQLVTTVATTVLPTDYGNFQATVFRSTYDSAEHIALYLGIDGNESLSYDGLARSQYQELNHNASASHGRTNDSPINNSKSYCESISDPTAPVLARVQAEHPLSDLFEIPLNKSRDKLHKALSRISEQGRGALVYIRHPRRHLLEFQVKALQKQSQKSSETIITKPTSPERQLREFGIGAQILLSLGIRRITLLGDPPTSIRGIEAFHLEIVSNSPL